MTNYWAIAIGINQYEKFQPLTYAERDAQVMHNFWSLNGGIPIEQCWLLSDNSTPIGSQPTFPNRDTIIDLLTDLCQRRLRPDDMVWLFFSGYGAQYQGKDYLLPIDADPTRVAETAIAMDELFGILQASPTPNILTLLDMNRSQGTLGGEGAGRQALQMAQDMQRSLVLSCRPDQFSHETLLLRQGLFTAALMEGLRSYGCLTPEHLAQFLRDRLPELSEHHWRPRQDPVAIIPDSQRYLLLLPGKPRPSTDLDAGEMPIDPTMPSPDPTPTPDPTPSLPPPDSGPSPEGIDEQSWQRLLRLGGLALLALLGLVVVRNIETVIRPVDNRPSPPGDLAPASPAPISEPAGTVPPATPLPDPLVQPGVGEPLPLTPTPAPVPQAPNELPPVGSGGDGAGQPPALSAVERDRIILDAARSTLSRMRSDAPTNQVSEIAEAIRQLRQIQPDHPLYAEAQQFIDRWSGMVLDMAIGRAARRNGGDSIVAAQNYQAAIAAAQLVPTDRPEIYNSARRSITVWSQKTMDLAHLHASEGALGLAIAVANYVSPNTPAYAEAQRAIGTWQAQMNPPQTTQKTAEAPVE